MRQRIVTILALFLVLGLPQSSLAQADTGEIHVVITDPSQKPVNLARVLLEGPVIASEFSGSNGSVRFTDVPDGIYRARVFKSGFAAVTSAQFEVLGGRSVTISVTLAAASGLKTIAIVSAKSTAVIATSEITSDSAQRKLSSDLADALNKLSGVAVSLSSDDTDAAQTISLEGHDPSQTQLTLDGIPLNAPGTAGDLRSFASDLFSGASVKYGPSLGGLGGAVNFRTIEPTIAWLGSQTMGVGSNGKYNVAVSESGSIGKLGIATMFTTRRNTSLADGLSYLDQSGFTYSHDGDATNNGALVKFRYAINDSQTLVGSYLGSSRTAQLTCLRISATLPCGFGPGNTASGNFALFSLTDSALVGDTSLQASIFGNRSTFDHDLTHRYVDGVAQPTGFLSSNRSLGYSVNAELPAQNKHTISISAYGTNSTSALSPLVTQSTPYFTSARGSSYSSLQISDAIRSSSKLTLSDFVGVSSTTQAATSALGGVSATWRPTEHDALSASYSLGGNAPGGGHAQALSDPASLRFDCNGNVAYGNAPGDNPQGSSSTSARVDYTHSIAHGNIALSLYRQSQKNVVLPALVNGSVLSPSLFPTGYFGLVQALHNSTAGCNTAPGTSFGPQNIYFTSPVSGVTRIYQGARLSAYIPLGNFVIQPFADITSATIASSDPRIVNPYGIITPGAQVPNTPLHRAGVTVDYKATGSSIEWLADAQYTGANNPNNLPAFTTFDLGASAKLARGSLTVAASNISNIFAGTFASNANAVPYSTIGGIPVATIAQPLAPRTYSATYSVRFGPGAQALPQARAFTAPQSPGPKGRGGRARLFSPLPTTPPPDPFAVVPSQRCNASDLQLATVTMSTVKNFVAEVEAAKTSAGYPTSMKIPFLTLATLEYHSLGATYALSLVPKPTANVRALILCTRVHLARATDVTANHLYAPSTGTFFRPQLNFMPSVGLYIVAKPPVAGQETFRVYALPTAAPLAPFTLQAGSTCTADLRAVAEPALRELVGHFTSGAATLTWTIVQNAAAGGFWYALTPNDPSVSFAVIRCARVAAGTLGDVQARGLNGVTPPNLNYAPGLGLYVLRRAAPPSLP